MPWKSAASEQELRAEFIQLMLKSERSVSALCKDYGIARKTAYKWKRRYLETGDLSNRSTRPKTSPSATPHNVVDAILQIRGKHQTLGGTKISIMLRRKGLVDVPSGTTVTSILRRHNLLNPRAVAEAKHYVRFTKDKPNEMWQVDFKGHFPMCDGNRCHPLNAIDDYSRFNICSEPLLTEDYATVKRVFERVFRQYGLPFSLLCDNGRPWGGISQRIAITRFEVWLMELGVLTLHGKAAHPQTQGKDERYNKSFTRELLSFRQLRDLNHARAEFEEYRRFYNTERPHLGIGGLVPADLYEPSRTPYPELITTWQYDRTAKTRMVSESGYVSFGCRHLFVSEGLAGKMIAFVPTHDDGVFYLLFRNFIIGKYDLHTSEYVFRKPYLTVGDPRPWAPKLV